MFLCKNKLQALKSTALNTKPVQIKRPSFSRQKKSSEAVSVERPTHYKGGQTNDKLIKMYASSIPAANTGLALGYEVWPLWKHMLIRVKSITAALKRFFHYIFIKSLNLAIRNIDRF